MPTKRKPYELELLPLPLNAFGRQGNRLVAEASDLPAFRLQPLYNDAADEGIAILSHYTGRVVRFLLTEEQTNEDGEITAWTFQALAADAKGCSTPYVTIFND